MVKRRHPSDANASLPVEAGEVEVTVEYLGDAQFEVAARNHKVICDQPVENGGFDEGMTPPELMLASLGTCAGYYAAQYLRTRNLPSEGMLIRIVSEKAMGPARLADFKIQIKLPASLDGRHHEGLLRAAKSCLIHNTLLNPPSISTEVTYPLPARAA
jgi:uncharacterized OsmC-like protein